MSERGMHEEDDGRAGSSQNTEGSVWGQTPFLQLYQEFKEIRIDELTNSKDVNKKLEFANKFLGDWRQLCKDSQKLQVVLTELLGQVPEDPYLEWGEVLGDIRGVIKELEARKEALKKDEGRADSSKKRKGLESGPTPFLQLYKEFKAIRINELTNTQDLSKKLEFANKFLGDWRQLGKDSQKLQIVLYELLGQVPEDPYLEWGEVLGDIRGVIKDLEARKEAVKKVEVEAERLAALDYKIAEVELVHDTDYQAFKMRVDELFNWYKKESEQDKYMSPYFPMVQSSGMGKTKLMFTLCKDEKKDYRTILVICTMDVKPNVDHNEEVFQYQLHVEGLSTVKKIDSAFNAIINKEESIYRESLPPATPVNYSKARPKKLVLMFDEAQHMLKGDALVFRRIRNLLRHKKSNERFVAVFTGTNSNLANYYDDKKGTGDSRNPEYIYNYGTHLYEPFYQFCTIGCLRAKTAGSLSAGEPTDYHRAIPYGRPLFSLLYQDNHDNDVSQSEKYLSLEQYCRILTKMLLGENSFDKLDSCLSVLATRVQLGRTTFLVACNLVAKGYGNLVNFCQSADGRPDSAQVRYYRDPVLARLAMCLMDQDWNVEYLAPGGENNVGQFSGEGPKFWSGKLSEVLSNGLCFAPKGDVGEMAAALYMLFCGDVLRKQVSSARSYTTFAVDVEAWIGLLQGGGVSRINDETDATTDEATSTESLLTISCIQFCRSELRWNPWFLFNQAFLKTTYESGVAFYLHAGFTAIDMVCCIKQKREQEDRYIPVLVSVKTIQDYGTTNAKSDGKKMVKFLKNVKRTIRKDEKLRCLCLLLVLDCATASQLKEKTWLGDLRASAEKGKDCASAVDRPTFDIVVTNNIRALDKLDSDVAVFKLATVPTDDVFGISAVIRNTCYEREDMAEIYSSLDSMGDTSLEEISLRAFVSEVDSLRENRISKKKRDGEQPEQMEQLDTSTQTKPKYALTNDVSFLSDLLISLRNGEAGLDEWREENKAAADELLQRWLPGAKGTTFDEKFAELGLRAWLRKTGSSNAAFTKVTAYFRKLWLTSIEMAPAQSPDNGGGQNSTSVE